MTSGWAMEARNDFVDWWLGYLQPHVVAALAGSITCSDFLRQLCWLSSALGRILLRQRSAIRTATTHITTAHLTLPMFNRACMLTLAVGCWGIVLPIWSTPRPAFAGGRSRCDFRGRRLYARHSELFHRAPILVGMYQARKSAKPSRSHSANQLPTPPPSPCPLHARSAQP